MHATWFALLSLMLTAYAVLDGFDFGAGIVHLIVTKTEEERQRVLAAVGPLWDGNEVWLIASGGVLVFAFPRAYAAAFSGLYLPLMVVLWLLVLRGLAIEFRSAVENLLWRAAWDTIFAISSGAMAIILGVALGNVVRGVPLGKDGYFHEDLFASSGSARAGAFDPLTAAYGLFAFVALGAHGATFVAWKTDGVLGARSRATARRLWVVTVVLVGVVTAFTAFDQPAFFKPVMSRIWLWPLPLCAIAAAAFAFQSLALEHDLRAFLASCGFIASFLLATAGVLYPTILRSTLDEAFTIDAHNAASSRSGLRVALGVFIFAIALASSYFAYLFYAFRGKTHDAASHGAAEPHR